MRDDVPVPQKRRGVRRRTIALAFSALALPAIVFGAALQAQRSDDAGWGQTGATSDETQQAYSAAIASDEVVADPNNPTAPTSTTATVTANGTPIVVKTEVLDHYDNSQQVSYEVVRLDVAKFTMSTNVNVVVTKAAGAISACNVRPDQLAIATSISGNSCSFTLSKPTNVQVEIDDLSPVVVLATPHETETYSASTSAVTVYPAGEVIDAGVINAQSNHTYYIPAGTLIKGVFNLKNVENVRILGRGLIDGRDDSRNTYVQPVIYVENSSNVRVNGVGIRGARGWQMLLYMSRWIDVSYINNIGAFNNNDGLDIDSVTDVTIRNNFIVSGDDGFGWHAMGSFSSPVGTIPDSPMARVLAENNTIRTYVTGSAFRFGASFESNYVNDVVVRDTYALGWGVSGIAIDPADYVRIRNTLIENFYGSAAQTYVVRGVTKYTDRFINMKLGCQTWSNPNTISIDGQAAICLSNYEAGDVRGVRLRNVSSAAGGSSLKPRLHGQDDNHRIAAVFENVRSNGTLITSASQLDLNAYGSAQIFSSLQPLDYDYDGVVDSGRGTFATSGTWYASSLPGYGASTSLYASAAGATATWTPSIAVSGYHHVDVWYPHSENSTRSATYTVRHADGETSIAVDQTGLGGIWLRLGTFRFAAGLTGQVQLTVGTGNTRADAIRVEPVTIIDQTDGGFSASGTLYASSLKGFGNSTTAYVTGASTATWSATVSEQKLHTIYVWYPAASNSDANAQYTVQTANGARTITVNQTTYAGRWRSIGTFVLAAGTGPLVTLKSGGGMARADAVLIEPVPD